MRSQNHWYGHARAFAAYVGLEGRIPRIWPYLQHGWNIDSGFSNDSGKGSRMLSSVKKLVWNDHNVRAAEQIGLKRVVPIGAPFLYLPSVKNVKRPERVGTLLIVPHRGTMSRLVGSHDSLAPSVRDREKGRVTACLFSYEFADPRVRTVYESQGFDVITNGQRTDPNFLERQVTHLQTYERVVSPAPCTGLFYGAYVGCEIEVYGPVLSPNVPGRSERIARYAEDRLAPLLSGPLRPKDARSLAARELGESFLRDPRELAELLGWTGLRRMLGDSVSPLVVWRRRMAKGIEIIKGNREIREVTFFQASREPDQPESN